MTIETAQKLKAAGFPNVFIHCKREDHDCRANLPDCDLRITQRIELERLMAECHNDLKYLIFHDDKRWEAKPNRKHINRKVKSQFADDPREAVAALYLAINA